MAKKAATILVQAQQELLDTNAKLSDTGRRRDQLLLANNDATGLDAIEVELANLQKASVRQADRIKLLEEQARAEEADAVLQRRKAHVARFTKILRNADEVADELQACVEQEDKLYRRLIQLREDARVAWWGSNSHENALAVSPDGAALSGIAIKALLMHEIYRVGARPFVGGTAGELKAPDLPGGLCPDHRLLGQPHLIEPFGARMRKASQAAIDVMRGKIPEANGSATLPSVPDAPPPPAASGNGGETPDPLPTTDQAKLAALLKRQAQLAEDMTPEGEAKYQAVVAEIAALS